MRKSKVHGAFHAIDATPARWRGDAGSSPLERAETAACDVLREWGLSVRGLYVYELPKEYRDLTSSTPAYLENCPTAATPVIPAYLRFPRAAPEPKGSL